MGPLSVLLHHYHCSYSSFFSMLMSVVICVLVLSEICSARSCASTVESLPGLGPLPFSLETGSVRKPLSRNFDVVPISSYTNLRLVLSEKKNLCLVHNLQNLFSGAVSSELTVSESRFHHWWSSECHKMQIHWCGWEGWSSTLLLLCRVREETIRRPSRALADWWPGLLRHFWASLWDR